MDITLNNDSDRNALQTASNFLATLPPDSKIRFHMCCAAYSGSIKIKLHVSGRFWSRWKTVYRGSWSRGDATYSDYLSVEYEQ